MGKILDALNSDGMTRRRFLAASASAAALVGVGGLSGCSPQGSSTVEETDAAAADDP